MIKSTDAEARLSGLMRAVQNGDGAAYARLLDEVASLLRNTIRSRNRALQPADVEDLVQDVLLSLHAVRATYDPKRPFLPWLFGIAHNRMVDGARRYARRAAHETSVEHLPEVPVTFSVDPAKEEYGDAEALRRAIVSLPPAQREAVEMLKIRELTLKEASAASGVSIAALKVSVHRAIKSLRSKLGQET